MNVAPADVMHGLAAPAWQHLDAKHTLGLLPGPGFAPAVKLNELRDQMLDGVGCGVALGFLGLSFLGRRVDTLFQLWRASAASLRAAASETCGHWPSVTLIGRPLNLPR